ncbi:O-antigen ligase family protein [Neorhodopirellula pilleata]|uniref:O-Antigen ligase n=1 Tax=Neorhodopirellula pilleata TaxID=2714738 RepID=A0A5C6AE10_9BACT|nr:O-antigen ligase family protein [Neorhodopirellula pilleata]TWT96473.1 O-Antigen ligase [Neorhodopirellula pilleata]
MKSATARLPSTSELQWINFSPDRLLVPAILCFWVLCFIGFSEPDDWRVSRFGVTPILPPVVLKAMKLFGRGGAFGVMAFCLLGVWKHPKRHHVIVVMAPMLMFGAYGVVSTSWSALKSTSLQQSATFFMVLMLATYIGIVWRSDRDTERIVKNLALAIFALSIVMIALRFGMPRSGALTKDSAGVLHSTAACASGGLCILLTLAARLLWKSPWSSWWFPIVSIELGMMLLAGNRLSVLVTALTVFALFVIALHRGFAALCLLVGAVTLSGYLVCDPKLTLVEAMGKDVGAFAKQDQTKSQLGSFSGRSEMWEQIWRSYSKSPLIGHGYFVTSETGRIYVWHEWGNWTAHNAVLQTLVTLGAIGLLLLALGLGSLTIGVISALRRVKGIENSTMLLILISMWYLGWSFLNESFTGPLQPEVIVFGAMVGVAAGIGGAARSETLRANRSNPHASLRSRVLQP